jgi:hypothetical protein
MGCRTHWINDVDEKQIGVRFSEGNDDVSCLCTERLDQQPYPIHHDTLRSFALLGAAVAMLRTASYPEDYFILPNDLPDFIVEGIFALTSEVA